MRVQAEQITMVFCDIEHSTRLVQQLGQSYPSLLERYRKTIRTSIEAYEGREIDTSGDGFFMIFSTPENAVSAVSEMQIKFHNELWATNSNLKVRFGIHSGKALPTETGYAGVEVHAASRICDAAHGGQVIMSGATKDLLDKNDSIQVTLSNLGDYFLKDIKYPTHLFQLIISGISTSFPKPRIVPNEKKIAILPFSLSNIGSEYTYIGEGIADDLIIALGRVSGLRVVSRSTAFSLARQDLSITDIGKKQKIDAVLEGRIKVVENEIIISVELVDAQSGLNIWADLFHGKRNDISKIQDEIILRIAESFNCPLLPGQVSINSRQSDVPEAYDYYLKGRRFYFQFSTRGALLAIKMFEKAIEADNYYALAYTGLADSYSYLYQHKESSPEILEKANVASKEAVRLSPELSKAHVSRGIVLALIGDYASSEESFEKAIELNPSLFLAWFHYGRMCFSSGNLEKAARYFQQANKVEPEDFQSILLSAQIYDDFGSADFARILRKRGIKLAKNALDLNPGDIRALYFISNAYAQIGKKEKSLKYIHLALQLESDDSMLLYNAGCVFALLGMTKNAMTSLERAYKSGLNIKGWYENDSNLKSLRGKPRFKKLLDKMS